MSNKLIKRMWLPNLSDITSKGKRIENCWKISEQDFKISRLNGDSDIYIVEKIEQIEKCEQSTTKSYYLQENKKLIEISLQAYEVLFKIAKIVSEYNELKAILSNYPDMELKDILNNKNIKFKNAFTNILIRRNNLGGTLTILIEFENKEKSERFIAPIWFGNEITDTRYKMEEYKNDKRNN